MPDVGSGFVVDIYPDWLDDHRRLSILILRLVWTNLDALFFGHQEVREIPYPAFTIRIYRFRGWGWLTLPLFPIAMIHESLHFIIGYLTKNRHLVTLIPPLLDLTYLPLLFVWASLRPNIYFFLVVSLWIEWCWIIHLMSNLRGDFAPYLRKIKHKREHPDTKKQEVG